MRSLTVSVSVSRPPAEVYHFVTNPENMPDWATAFCLSIDRQESDWIMDTPDGQMKIRFIEANPYGVMDHYITVSPGVEIAVPMRVVPNASGAEVSLTLFQLPGMSEERLERDRGLVEKDLQTLKRVLEG